jgi:hypothetical protein
MTISRKYILNFIAIVVVAASTVSCNIYKFNPGDVGTAETFQVNFFQNNAPIIEPGLDREFTNALIDAIQNQSNLSLTTNNADVLYEGEIVEYRIAPMTATAEQTAAQNRLTIGVNVRYFNKTNPDSDYEKRFSFFYDYPAAQQINQVKDAAFQEIFERLTLDIFSASFNNW